MRFLLLGAGFWAGYQLAAWRELGGAECVGVCDPDESKARQLAERFGVRSVFTDAAEAITQIGPDFADIVTPPETHAPLIRLCAEKGVPVICQKPLATTLGDAEEVVLLCERAGVPLLVHENWRWQAPLREGGNQIRNGAIGTPFRARLSFVCSFPVFENQPFLATLPQFLLADIGPHVLDAARFLFGEARTLYATTKKVNPEIAGEDVATVLMTMGDAETTVLSEMSYASRTRQERFPQTYLFVEGDNGSLEIGPDYLLHITTRDNGDWQNPHTTTRRVTPLRYDWANPQYDLVQASMVPCLADLLAHLRGEKEAETTGRDNLQTVRLVFAAYDSAAQKSILTLARPV